MRSKIFIFLLVCFFWQLTNTQFSWVPSRVMQACTSLLSQDQVVLTHSSPSTDLTNASVSNPYVFNLQEPHYNVKQHALVFAGHSSPSNPMDCSFAIYNAGQSTTQFNFTLYVYATSAFRKLLFSLVLLGNEGVGIELKTLNMGMSVSSSPHTSSSWVYSLKSYYNPSVFSSATPYIFLCLLNSFQLTQQFSLGTKFTIGLVNNFYSGNGTVDVRFYTAFGGLLTWVQWVWILWANNDPTVTTDMYARSFNYTYPQGITKVESNVTGMNMYPTGYNRKCMIGQFRIEIGRNREYLFDVNYPFPNLNYSAIDPTDSFHNQYFCFSFFYNCSLIDPECIQCTSQTICSQCSTQYYPNGVSYVYSCLLCNTVFSCCSSCDNSSVCLGCDTGYYLSAAGVCQLENCVSHNTVNSTYIECTQCIPGYVNVTGRCSLCSLLIYGCDTCTSSGSTITCTLCLPQYSLVPGGCTYITGCTSIFPGTQICLTCSIGLYEYTPVDNTCVCLEGVMINGICSVVPGCISPYVINGAVDCLFCNVTLAFDSLPMNGICNCQKYYELKNENCSQICGDGVYLGKLECDDGNTLDGDGCSSICTVEVGYRCFNGSSNSPSACTYVGIPLILTLTKIKRNAQLNQGLFYFKVYPPLLSINQMNLTQYIQLSCDATYTIFSINYNTKGTLTLAADYSTDLEGLPCNITLAFDSRIIRSYYVTVSFDAVSETLPLLILQHQDELRTVRTIFTVISYIAMGVFFLSLGHKMIGVEIMANFQLIYLSNVLYHKFYFFFNELRRLQLVTGYWSLFYQDSDSDFYPPFSQRVDMTPYFLENSLILLAVLMPGAIIFLVLKAIHRKKIRETTPVSQADQQNETQEEPIDTLKLKFLIIWLYRMLIFPVSAGFLIVLMVSSYVNNMRLTNLSEPVFPQLLGVITLVITWLILSNVCSAQFFIIPPQLTGLKDAKCWYIPLFLLKSLAMAAFVSYGVTKKYDTLVYYMTLFEGVYILILVFIRPYKKAIDNVGIIILEFTTLYALVLPISMRYISVGELDQIFLVFILQGMLLISLGLSLARIISYYFNVIKNYLYPTIAVEKILKDTTSKINEEKIKNFEVVDELKLQLKKMNPYSIYNNFPQTGIDKIVTGKFQQNIRKGSVDVNDAKKVKRGEEEHDYEDPELTAAKKRLREDLLRKKAMMK